MNLEEVVEYLNYNDLSKNEIESFLTDNLPLGRIEKLRSVIDKNIIDLLNNNLKSLIASRYTELTGDVFCEETESERRFKTIIIESSWVDRNIKVYYNDGSLGGFLMIDYTLPISYNELVK